ncbi:membrane fusion protein, cobalt-zinc-cadmium efflux system [Roseateles sp. YR242]|uniref:efflux RND transporter periplasmic adaptor subunit n=1 Tax=Roseateles sp. YR242 TaxID=1855305 RepID=UPI0008AD90ED|nr:efflux RND transporter periplasmic adaptor subunit [Roseateles sp. YR242]SEL39159.1 membrane fusion protein, cobalt-zinc-cadmium efflux system [Roseateles sp. YR242]
MKTPFEFKQPLSSSVSTKQAIAIAIVLLFGVAAGAIILTNGNKSTSEDAHGHEEAKGHDDGEHHGEGQASEDHTKTDKAGGHGKAEGQGNGHDEKGRGDEAKGHSEEGGHAEVIKLTAAQQKEAGIVVEKAQAATLRSTYQLPGEIGFDEDRTAHVVPRVSGVVEAVPVALGQAVRKGQVLAVISSPAVSDQRAELQAAQKRLQLARTTHDREQRLFEERISPQQDVQIAEQALREAEIAVDNARQKLKAVGASPDSSALNRFEIRAPFDGIVVQKHLSLGEQVREDTNVFTVSDLRTVWAQISVPAKDLTKVRVGDGVTVRSASFEQSASGKVAYVGSLIGEQTRTAQARVTLQNPDAIWRPGLFVNVDVAGAAIPVAVAVTADAVQTVEGRTVVFVKVPDGFAAQPVKVGRSDAQRVEILAGLAVGTAYIAQGSFVAKAEAGKSSASHQH